MTPLAQPGRFGRKLAPMKPLPLLVLAAAASGCASPRPHAPVRGVAYSAIGAEPFWMLTIGDDRIVLTRGTPERAGLRDAVYPRVLPRTVDRVRVWESGEGLAVISIEARPRRCTGPSGIVYEDEVRVRLSGLELSGCGGRILGERSG